MSRDILARAAAYFLYCGQAGTNPQGGGKTGSYTSHCAASEQRQERCGLLEKPHPITPQNPEKTDGGALVSSYGCSPLTVDEEFLLSKRQYEQSTGRSQKNNVIAYQIRQSFKPGEITPEEANKVGYELAMRWTKGKYQFFVCTHTDRQHIHNHILYNSTSMDGSRKFRDFWLSGLAVQRLSDVICLEHKLSVIETKPYRERQKRTLYSPKESNRDCLCTLIDNILRGETPRL